jgi:DNA mismatch endonuclease (patch repair protein)
MDKFSKAKRSLIMAAIKGKNTQPELFVRKILWAAGYRYRLHAKDLPGCPDIVSRSKRKAVFVNGCFWHGHKCRKGKLPKTRTKFWAEKIQRNKKRDAINLRKLKRTGWQYLNVWECEIKKPRLISKMLDFLAE